MKRTIRTSYETPGAGPIKDMSSGEAEPNFPYQLAQVETALEKTGLVNLAAFHPSPDEDIPIRRDRPANIRWINGVRKPSRRWQHNLARA